MKSVFGICFNILHIPDRFSQANPVNSDSLFWTLELGIQMLGVAANGI